MSQFNDVTAIVLAAGKGTRMKSAKPKVLHEVLGMPMLKWVLEAVHGAGVEDQTIILSQDHQGFENFLNDFPEVSIAVQPTQQGTGDAVSSAACAFKNVKTPSYSKGVLQRGKQKNASERMWTLIVAGDTPAISSQTLKDFIGAVKGSGKKLGVLGTRMPDPRGYGRLVCSQQKTLARIVEERDADLETKKINLCNTGVIVAQTEYLFELLSQVTPNNAQNEYYLTDIFSISADREHLAFVYETAIPTEFSGINDRGQLESLENWMLDKKMAQLMLSGVTIHRSQSVYLEGSVKIEADTEIFPQVVLTGDTRIARNCTIGPGAMIQDSHLSAGVVVGSSAVIVRSQIEAGRVIPAGAVIVDSVS
ncbi:MAG: NTP transferase domain-containing protein [Proteobacteria bacterium]|nr:NTP transferase domain-containing protein [Pseudomonadota bacterium]